MDVNCLKTVVRCNVAKYFGFLPPHGLSLTAGQEVSYFGDLLTILAAKDAIHDSTSLTTAFTNALQRGDITIRQTPNPTLKDTVTGTNKIVKLTSGTIGTADPCWESGTLP